MMSSSLRLRHIVVLGALSVAALIPSVAAYAESTTTTSSEVTTTTVAPTTTTVAPTTTTTVAPTTTTTVPATTTTAKPISTGSVSLIWAWILGAVAVLALIAAGVAAYLGKTKREQAQATWVPSARAALETASLARSMLVSQPTGGDSQLAQVRAQGEDAARALDRVAQNAPDDILRQAASSTAEGLRGVLFSLEAEHLLRSGPTAPTAEQLASADIARRRRAAELDASIAQLDLATRPPAR